MATWSFGQVENSRYGGFYTVMWPYIGGKKMHAKWINPMFPKEFDTYVEVFGGANWMYFMSDKTPVETNVYNDWNRDLYNVFECSCSDPERFERELKALYPIVGDADKFIEFRDEVFDDFNTFNTPDYERAAKYMFLQTQYFTGGKGLTEKTKIYHNPKYKSKFLTYTEKFQQTHYLDKLRRLQSENMDCRDVIRKYDSENSFFYIDPPYFNLEDYYTKTTFGYDDHIELLKQLHGIEGKFALSYYYFEELEQILPRDKFFWHEEKTYTNNGLKRMDNITSKDGKPAKGIRPERVELLIMNYVPSNITINTELFDFG